MDLTHSDTQDLVQRHILYIRWDSKIRCH